MMGRMLVTGASGFLGGEVARRAVADGWTVIGTYLNRPGESAGWVQERLDIRDRTAVLETVRRIGPDVVVHTAVGRHRDDWPATADGAAHVALAASAIGRRLVHVSSDAIFSGRDVHYDESALPDPVNQYGAAKAAAETAVRAIDPGAAIVRTSLILGYGVSAQEKLVHDLASGRMAGALFTDEFRKPVHVADLADAILELAGGDYRGPINVAGADVLSRYELGVLVAERDGLEVRSLPTARVADLGLNRPTDVRLTLDRAESVLATTRLRGASEFMAVPVASAP